MRMLDDNMWVDSTSCLTNERAKLDNSPMLTPSWYIDSIGLMQFTLLIGKIVLRWWVNLSNSTTAQFLKKQLFETVFFRIRSLNLPEKFVKIWNKNKPLVSRKGLKMFVHDWGNDAIMQFFIIRQLKLGNQINKLWKVRFSIPMFQVIGQKSSDNR